MLMFSRYNVNHIQLFYYSIPVLISSEHKAKADVIIKYWSIGRNLDFYFIVAYFFSPYCFWHLLYECLCKETVH